jgi:hypothetical protein
VGDVAGGRDGFASVAAGLAVMMTRLQC